MSKPAGARVLQINLEALSDAPLYRQVYSEIRAGILSGRLRPGATLPSTRALSCDLGVSRSTIVLAYEQLRAEGYLVSRVGAGTQVSLVLPDTLTQTRRSDRTASVAHRRRPLATRVDRIRLVPDLAGEGRPRTARAFRSAVPALDAFPIDLWSKAVSRVLHRMPPRHLSYGDTFGYRPLREAVAAYLAAARGVRCTADQVMIVTGSQQALTLCADALLDPGAQAWIEDPGYFGAQGSLRAVGAELVPVPVDPEGLDVDYGRARAPYARAAYVTPSRQLPLGVTMSLRRRLAFLEWAASAGAWVIEDDYDSEFRYASRPLEALQGLDAEACVLYTSTFSKVMFPALRLGYLVVPDAVRDAFACTRDFMDFHGPYLEQAAMATFMQEGHFERHIRRMRSVYLGRRDVLLECLTSFLDGRVRVTTADAGMSLVAWLRPGDDEELIAAAAAQVGVEVLPLSRTAIEHRRTPGLILGFSGIPEQEIREGVRTLAMAIERYDRHHRAVS